MPYLSGMAFFPAARLSPLVALLSMAGAGIGVRGDGDGTLGSGVLKSSHLFPIEDDWRPYKERIEKSDNEYLVLHELSMWNCPRPQSHLEQEQERSATGVSEACQARHGPFRPENAQA